jgi:hypothetical protein
MERISMVFTDDRLSAEWIAQLREAPVPVTICGERGTENLLRVLQETH